MSVEQGLFLDSTRKRFLLRNISLEKSRRHDLYLTLEALCPEACFRATCWEQAELLSEILRDVHVVEACLERNSYGYHLKEVNPHVPQENFWDLFPRGPYNDEENWSVLLEQMDRLLWKDSCRDFLFWILEDEDFCRRYRRCPAALNIHHPFRGGLVAHVLSCLRNVEDFCRHYDADQSLVALGVFFHDVGKIWEIDALRGRYTPEGELLGHLLIACQWLSEKMKEKSCLSEVECRELLHILASHHGSREAGSPRPPMSQEALLVHFLDRLDSEMFQLTKDIEGLEKGMFSNFNRRLGKKHYCATNRIQKNEAV
jgi:3'-5' exoribonuclease